MDCASEFPAPWFVSTSLGCTPTYAITQADIDAGLVMKTVRYFLAGSGWFYNG